MRSGKQRSENQQADVAYEVLRDAKSDADEWVRYAETKNGLLITANLAAAGFLYTAFFTGGEIIWQVKVASFAATGTLLVSAVVALFSLFARLRDTTPSHSGVERSLGNPLYFQHAAQFLAVEYAQLVLRHLAVDRLPSQIELDLAAQIVANSRIAVRKFRLFNVSLQIAICGLAVPLTFGILGALFLK